MRYGQIHPPPTLFMRIEVGAAEGAEHSFEMSHSDRGTPIVRCVETGKWFTLTWAEILHMAEAAGITEG